MSALESSISFDLTIPRPTKGALKDKGAPVNEEELAPPVGNKPKDEEEEEDG